MKRDKRTQLEKSIDEALEELYGLNPYSEEYAKALKDSTARMITPVFQDWKGGTWKVISFYAKRARGLMARHLIQNRGAEALSTFAAEGYALDAQASTDDAPVFRRKV